MHQASKHLKSSVDEIENSKMIGDSYVSYLANGKPFELLGIPYLVGKIKFELFFQGPLAK